MASDDIRPFRVDVPQDVLDDLKDRLPRTRWPDQISGSGWGYGTDLAYLRDLCDSWQTTFDWRAPEDRCGLQGTARPRALRVRTAVQSAPEN